MAQDMIQNQSQDRPQGTSWQTVLQQVADRTEPYGLPKDFYPSADHETAQCIVYWRGSFYDLIHKNGLSMQGLTSEQVEIYLHNWGVPTQAGWW